MKNKLFLILALLMPSLVVRAGDINIIPMPQDIVAGEGYFPLTATTQLAWNGAEAKQTALFFAEKLKTATGREIKIVKLKKNPQKQLSKGSFITFTIDKTIEGDEAYRLIVTPERIQASASTGSGLFYALQSLLQLCPPDIENQAPLKTSATWHIPAVTINDAPRFPYRGFHLDPCRHFLPVAAVKKQLDMLATYKINKMHFHLTEDQGWRIEIKKYPELLKYGARRTEAEGNTYQGYYTQDDIRDIVAYAAERHIEVIPELEMPGHELAAISAYPELSCRGDSITPRIIWGVEDIVMCPGKEAMFTFLQNVIDEMVQLFPSQYFHIGGDESPRKEWAKCPRCQARMKELGYTREAQLQDYVIERVSAYLATKGKRIIGWNEILEGGNLQRDAIVMSWWSEEGAIAAARKNHQVIMTPSSHGLYFDHYQGDPINEPTSIGGYAPLEKVYSYNPIPEELRGTPSEKLVLGVQANNWSEYTLGPAQLENRLYPRALALAEIAWTQPEKKHFRDFCRRLDGDASLRLNAHHINYNIPQPEIPGVSSNRLAFTDRTKITLTTTRPMSIIYTTDGTTPTTHSKRYTAPIDISRSCQLKTAVILPTGQIGNVRTISIQKQTCSPAAKIKTAQPGLKTKIYYGKVRKPDDIKRISSSKDTIINHLEQLRTFTHVSPDVRGVEDYAAVAEGYINIPADGVYEFTSTNSQIYIDGALQIDNSRVFAPRDTRQNLELALSAGYHKLKVVFIGGIFGGWPTYWNDAKLRFRPSRGEWTDVGENMLYH